VAVAVVAPAVGVPVLLHQVDHEALKVRIVGEVQRATGRALSVGALKLHLLPELTVDATDVALANPAGFSRAAMITARRVHVAIAPIPLLFRRVVVRALSVQGMDVRLEQPAGQAPNWLFSHTRPSAALPHALAQAAPPRPPLGFTILGITADGALSWQTPYASGSAAIQALRLEEVNPSSTIFLAVTAALAGQQVQLNGKFGGQNHLWNAEDQSDWPVALTLTAPAGEIDVDGSVSRPRTLAGYDLTIDAQGPDLGALAAPFPDLPMPRLAHVVLHTRVVDRLDGVDIPRLRLTAGASDLSNLVPGLRLSALSIDAPNIDGTNGTQINHARADGTYAAQTLELNGSFGPVGRLFGRGQVAARSPIALDATATAAGASLRVNGRIAPTGDWAGTDAALVADVPDLAALTPLARVALPRLRDLTLIGGVRSQGGVLYLHGAHLTLPQADIAMEGTAALGGRARYRGEVRIARLDLDGLAAAVAAAPAAPAASAPTAAPPGPAAGPDWLIPDRKLPLEWLTGFDADVALSAGGVVLHTVPLSGISAHAVLADGRLAVSGIAARIAAAPFSGSFALDAVARPPRAALNLNAAGLDAAALTALLGAPGLATGSIDLTAGLTGAGGSPHALAATLNGHAGLALTNGALANGPLVRALAWMTPAARLGLNLPAGGKSEIACLATGIDLRQGVAVPQAFLLSTKRLRLAAAGAIDLRDETFALRLRPYIRLGGTGLVLPSRADGPWRDPRVTLEPASGTESAALLASGLVGADSGLAQTVALLAQPSETMLALADSGDCGPAIEAAHDTTGAAITLPSPPAPAKRPRRAIDLLRRLFK
jgi:AsmA protein